MASLYKKLINRKPYWYLREMARVEGRPRMVSERYLGTAADIAAAVAGRDAAALPTRTRHLGFGDAAAWGVLTRLGAVIRPSPESCPSGRACLLLSAIPVSKCLIR
jgi:hypothetical protein